jgi:Holliday junction resolvase RusA-like endonuclease
MKKLVTFSAFGLAVVPWSVPEIGVNRRGAKPVRFTKRSKKSKLSLGKASLEDWQKFVANAGREAMAKIPMPLGSIRLHIVFHTKTPKGKKHGQLWEVPLKWNEKAGMFVKSQPRGKPEPDLINMFKGTEDAIESVILTNDVQSRVISALTVYGPVVGVIVSVYEVEPTDFPGYGDPIE